MASSEFISVSGGVVLFPSQTTELYFRYLNSVIIEINENLKESNKNYSVISNLSADNFSSEYFIDFRLLKDSKIQTNAIFDYSFKLSFINNTLYFVTILGSVKIGEFESLEVVQSDIAAKLSKYGFSLNSDQGNLHNFDPQFSYNGLPIIEEKQEEIAPANVRKISAIIPVLLKKESAEFRGSIRDVKSFSKPVDLTKWFEVSQNLLPIPKNVLMEDLSANSQENGVEDSGKGSSDNKQANGEASVVNFVFTNNNDKVSCYPNPNDTNVQICNIDGPSKSESKQEATLFTWPNAIIAASTVALVVIAALKVHSFFTGRNRNNLQKQDELFTKLTTSLEKIYTSQGKTSPVDQLLDYDNPASPGGGFNFGDFSPAADHNDIGDGVKLVTDLLNDLKKHHQYNNQGKTAKDLLNAFNDVTWIGENGEKLEYPEVVKKVFSGTFKSKAAGLFHETVVDYSDMLNIEGFIEKFKEIFKEAKVGGVRETFLKRLAVNDASFHDYVKQYKLSADDKYFVRPETYNYLKTLLEIGSFKQHCHVNSFIVIVALKALAEVTGTEAASAEEIKTPNNFVEVLRNTAEATANEECYRSKSNMSDEQQDTCYNSLLNEFEKEAKNFVTFHFNDPRNNSVQEVVVNLSQHSCIEVVSNGESKVLEIKTDDLGGRYLEDITMTPDLEFYFCQKVMI